MQASTSISDACRLFSVRLSSPRTHMCAQWAPCVVHLMRGASTLMHTLSSQCKTSMRCVGWLSGLLDEPCPNLSTGRDNMHTGGVVRKMGQAGSVPTSIKERRHPMCTDLHTLVHHVFACCCGGMCAQVQYHTLQVIFQHLHLTRGGPPATKAPGVGVNKSQKGRIEIWLYIRHPRIL